MASKSTRARLRSEPEIVLRHGRPAAVIIDIEHYRELAEHAEDTEDLETLAKIQKTPAPEEPAYDPTERPIEEVLAELAAEVPAQEWARLPPDLSENLDHYLYGAPKK